MFGDPNLARGELLSKNPAFLKERVFQRELEKRVEAIREDFAIGKLMVSGDARYLSDDLMRLLAELARPASETAYQALMKECLSGAVVYVPQPSYPLQKQLTILRNPHISRNEEVLAKPLADVGPLREKYLSHLYYVVMVDSRSLIPDRLGGADYDGDTVHVYAEPLLNQCIRRNYQGGFENENNLPLLKIPAAEPLLADARDWQARFQAVKSTFSSRIGQISNAALRRSILAYDEHTPVQDRERYRKETEMLTILEDLELQYRKQGIKDNSGAKKGDSRFLKTILRGVFDAADYREQLRSNCFRAILPTRLHFIGTDPAEENEYRFPADEIVKCAELLGKRDFILEVLPGVARELAIDRTAKPETKKKRWWQRVKRA